MTSDKNISLPPTAGPAEWDLVMRPKTGWFDLHLGDLWRYRDLTMLFVWRDFVAQYKQTILGPLWHIIQPLFTTILFTVIFGHIAKISTDSVPPMLFYMAGITCWNYFADCLNRSSGTFINNASIFGKVYFPRLCVPVSVVISNHHQAGHPVPVIHGVHGLLLFQGRAHSAQCAHPAHAGAGAHHGRAGLGLGHHRLLAAPSVIATCKCSSRLACNCSCMPRR